MHAERRRGRTHARILYWFRTPPGVRVGRSPLDEDAIRSIEQAHPGIEFDWPRMLREPQNAPAPPPRPRAPERRARPRAVEAPPAPEAVISEGSSEPPPDLGMSRPADRGPGAGSDPAGTPGNPDTAAIATVAASGAPTGAESPAGARLGAEGLARLRARHADLVARIAERVAEPERREAMRAEAERLNPDAWATDEQVAAGLEGYEAVFESLRGVVGHRRKRRRRRGAAPGAADSDPGAGDEPV